MALQPPPRIPGESYQERKWKEEISSLVNEAGTTGGAPLDAKYVVTELDASLQNEKLLSPSSDLTLITNSSSAYFELKPSGVTPGSYSAANITVDEKGRITSAADGTSGLPAGGADGQILTLVGTTPTWADMDTKKYALELDDAGSGVIYVGEADPGTATSAASWRIKKITDTGDIEILWADGNSNFDNVWDNRTSLTYS